VAFGEDAAGDLGAHRHAIDALEQALVAVVVDEVELAAGAAGVGELAVGAVLEGPLAFARHPASGVPGVDHAADGEGARGAVDGASAGLIADRVG
jgi:hypothetical protein